MYVSTKPNASGTGIKEEWTFFSNLPEGVNLTQDTRIHLFPLESDLYLAIGTVMWKKRKRNESDGEFQKVAEDWAKVYEDEWIKVGDNCLPASARKIVPYALLNSTGDAVEYFLFVLGEDSSIAMLNGNKLAENALFSTLTYSHTSGTPSDGPRWTQMAYWNGTVVGYHDINSSSGMTWDLTIDRDSKTYTIAQSSTVGRISDMTATEVGIVGAGTDGYLYRRLVDLTVSDEQGNPIGALNWKKWIPRVGVTNLGVASPGATMNLRSLTHLLRGRYLDTQAVLYEPVSRLYAFGTIEDHYLQLLLDAANEYKNANSEEQKHLAFQKAKQYITHTRIWSEILATNMENSKASVFNMTKQMKDIKTQIKSQLSTLKYTLEGFKDTLDTNQDVLDQMEAMYLGTVLAGIGLLILGAFLSPLTGGVSLNIGAGLFAAGMIASLVLVHQLGDLVTAVAESEAKIRDTGAAIKDLAFIADNFEALEVGYEGLNMFWGRLATYSREIVDAGLDVWSDAMEDYGHTLLEDTSALIAAQAKMQEMANAAEQYLDVLNEQGVIVHDTHKAALRTLRSPQRLSKDNVSQRTDDHSDYSFLSAIEEAKTALVAKDLDGYNRVMARVANAEAQEPEKMQRYVTSSGHWIDVPALKVNSSVFMSASPTSSLTRVGNGGSSSNLSQQGQRIKGGTEALHAALTMMVEKTRDLSSEVQRLVAEQPSSVEKFSTIQKEKIQSTKDAALAACRDAQHAAAKANNHFVKFNHDAREYQSLVQVEIGRQKSKRQATIIEYNHRLNNIKIPPLAFLSPITIIVYRRKEKNKIENWYRHTMAELSNLIQNFHNLKDSGLLVDGEMATWEILVKTISRTLGRVCLLLTIIGFELEKSPELYKELLSIQWGTVRQDCQEVLKILQSQMTSQNTNEPSLPPQTTTNRKRHPKITLTISDDKELILAAIKPPTSLTEAVETSRSQAAICFSSLEEILSLPFARDLAAFWEEGEEDRTMMYDVAYRLRGEYANTISRQYNAITRLYSISLLQGIRARSAAAGTLPIDVFLEITKGYISNARDVADAAATRFQDAAYHFELQLGLISANVDHFQEMLDGLNEDITEAEDERRSTINKMVASAIVAAIGTAAVLILSGGSATSATIALAFKLAAGGLNLTLVVMEVLSGLSVQELNELIASLQMSRHTVVESVAKFRAIREPFAAAAAGSSALPALLGEMSDRLAEQLAFLDALDELQLTPGDAAGIGDAWEEVGTACVAWLDQVHAQGISPVTGSIRA